MSRPALLLALALAAGCAPRSLGPREPRSLVVAAPEATVRVVYWAEDAAAAAQVERALRPALARASRWGAFQVPVTVTIHPTHAALEAAVRREGYPWLRAWARYATIDLQSPSTWGSFPWLSGGATDAKVTELLTHELTHCAMYQRAGTEWTWSYKGIPVWFREGMASVAAEQGRRRGTVEDLYRYYVLSLPGSGDGEPGARLLAARGKAAAGDPLGDPEPLYQDSSEVVYGASHHAFAFLLERYGEERVGRVLDRMRADRNFARAFREEIGLTEDQFTAEFRRFVVWQGWRREP